MAKGISRGCRGLCLVDENGTNLIHGIWGNPYIYTDSLKTVQKGLDDEDIFNLNMIIKIDGGYYDPDNERWVTV